MGAEWNRQLTLDEDDEVGKSGGCPPIERVEVRRHVGQHFGALRDAETQPRFGSADDVGPLTDGPIHTVLRLQAPIWNDPARICDVGPVSGNLRGAVGTAVSSKSR